MTSKKTETGWLGHWPRIFLAFWLGYWPRFLFLLPLIAVLWVPSYNRLEPTLGGIPFFYWYQLAWILIGSLIVMIVYLIETRVTRVAEKTRAGLDTKDAPGDIL
jgi:hypothetical protein